MPRWPLTSEERFDQNVYPEPNSGCWLWAGHADMCGYGKIHIDGWPQMAHRVAFQRAKGPIPDGFEIDHLCSVRCCVNPDHLEAVTPAENKRRTAQRGRASSGNAKKTHCDHGHPFSGSNLYIRPKGDGRDCMTCRREGQARWRARNKAA